MKIETYPIDWIITGLCLLGILVSSVLLWSGSMEITMKVVAVVLVIGVVAWVAWELLRERPS